MTDRRVQEPLDTETIRKIVGYLREGGTPAFLSDRYTTTIDPFWFSTPVRRGVLWEAIARVVALEERHASPR